MTTMYQNATVESTRSKSKEKSIRCSTPVSASFTVFDCLCLFLSVCCARILTRNAGTNPSGPQQLPFDHTHRHTCTQTCANTHMRTHRHTCAHMHTHTHTPQSPVIGHSLKKTSCCQRKAYKESQPDSRAARFPAWPGRLPVARCADMDITYQHVWTMGPTTCCYNAMASKHL